MGSRDEYFKEYYKRNKEKKNAYAKQYLKDFPEKNKEYCRRYWKKNNKKETVRTSYVDEFERHIEESPYDINEIKKLLAADWKPAKIASYKNLYVSTVERIAYSV